MDSPFTSATTSGTSSKSGSGMSASPSAASSLFSLLLFPLSPLLSLLSELLQAPNMASSPTSNILKIHFFFIDHSPNLFTLGSLYHRKTTTYNEIHSITHFLHILFDLIYHPKSLMLSSQYVACFIQNLLIFQPEFKFHPS